ncbi:MAG: hypothetical protein GX442_07925 [Candidatus Riflebacteria bacterium]|nr:hypothetical protein [Candidatus Riflebacteria bacterium]
MRRLPFFVLALCLLVAAVPPAGAEPVTVPSPLPAGSPAAGEPAAAPQGGNDPLVPPRDKVASFQLDLGSLGTLLLVEGKREGATGHFDELVLASGSVLTPVLKTEGRCLVGTAVGEFTAPGAKDAVLTLDTGGAGGFVDLVLLAVIKGKVVTLWEAEAVKGGRATFEDRTGDGRPELVVRRLAEDMATGEVSPETEVYLFQDGKVTGPVEGK